MDMSVTSSSTAHKAVPTYLSVIIPSSRYLLVIRILRVLRVYRVLKLVAYIGKTDQPRPCPRS